MLSPPRIKAFQRKILKHFHDEGRSFAWRKSRDPYRILVSEVMLQQTQTERVKAKYEVFLARFPTFEVLAAASRADVLKLWQGLGYNRRALALHECARRIVSEYGGEVPRRPELLQELPGIGPYTASALACFCWNHASVFIETNIRAVLLHEFFAGRRKVSDREILNLVEATLPGRDARTWYFALMDYGVMIKKTARGLNKKSRHYTKQSPFKGSNRQIRGQILREVAKAECLDAMKILRLIDRPKELVLLNLNKLVAEGFLTREGRKVRLSA